jgi:glycosyltransferase involved in cell wall biosynthesis
MRKQDIRRRIRLQLAPPGSRRDRWFRNLNNLRNKTSQRNLASIAVGLLPTFIRQKLKAYQRKRRRGVVLPLQSQLQEIIRQYPCKDRIFVFPPSLDWHTQLFQRPQQLALALARQGALVFYVQPEASSGGEAFSLLHKHIYLCHVPVETFEVLENPLTYLLTWNRAYGSVFNSPRIIYDFVDEIDVFEGNRNQMLRDHQKLIQNSELVLTTAVRLYNQVLSQREDVILCPNGVNYEHFAPRQSEQIQPPSDLAPILKTGKPVIGYYGALAIWFDYELLFEVAQHRRDLFFVLIGPDYDGTLPPKLLDLTNVSWLGVKAYYHLPNYVRFFDVATIPFRLNRITHATSPLKLFEYLAAGKPTVITAMEESMRYPGVLVANDRNEFIQMLDRGLILKDDQDYLRLIDKVARENTWDNRGKQILAALT